MICFSCSPFTIRATKPDLREPDMKELSDDIRCTDAFQDFLGDLAAVGVEPVTRGGIPYAVFGARSNPRWWLLPLDNRRAAASALEMFQPMTFAAQTAKTLACALTRYGPHRFLGNGQVRLSCLPSLVEAFDGQASHVAWFTGTDGPHRKTSGQFMTSSGEIVGYAKLTRNPLVGRYVKNEARVLAEVADLGLISTMHPNVIDLCDHGNATWLVTDSLRAPGHVVARRFGRAHQAFQAELAAKTMRPSAEATLSELKASFSLLKPALDQGWTTRLAEGIALIGLDIDTQPVALAHGDFTPWNVFLAEEKLYVFDWEYAHWGYPVGYDQMYFSLSTDLAAPAETLLDRLEVEIASAWYGADRRRALRAILFSLLLNSAFYFGRAIEAGDTTQSWGTDQRRARMIDTLLNRIKR